jgi:hypothetical protein
MPALNSSGTARKGRITIFRASAGLFTILFLTAAGMPILDDTQRETLAYMKQPTQQILDKLHAKQNEEVRKHWLYGTPLGLAAVAFAIPL